MQDIFLFLPFLPFLSLEILSNLKQRISISLLLTRPGMSPGSFFDNVLRTETGIEELLLFQWHLMFHLRSADPSLVSVAIRELVTLGASQRDTIGISISRCPPPLFFFSLFHFWVWKTKQNKLVLHLKYESLEFTIPGLLQWPVWAGICRACRKVLQGISCLFKRLLS